MSSGLPPLLQPRRTLHSCDLHRLWGFSGYPTLACSKVDVLKASTLIMDSGATVDAWLRHDTDTRLEAAPEVQYLPLRECECVPRLPFLVFYLYTPSLSYYPPDPMLLHMCLTQQPLHCGSALKTPPHAPSPTPS